MTTRFGIGVELGAALGLVVGAMLGDAGLGIIFGAGIGAASPAPISKGESGGTAALTMHDDPALTAAQIDYGGV